jgi:hypothetical protein
VRIRLPAFGSASRVLRSHRAGAFCLVLRRIDGRRPLEPDLDLVPIRIEKEHVGLAGSELATADDRATRRVDFAVDLVEGEPRRTERLDVDLASEPASPARRSAQ